jgi:glycosyltransferase involved in cell wall biosynthesis
MLRVLESRELRERIAAGGYERVARQFSAERMTREYVEEYESALSVASGERALAGSAAR